MAIIDVCVIGAGIAGIACARRLSKEGLKVVILDKSRGVGGRMATRRLDSGHLNHGLPYLEIQGDLTGELVKDLLSNQIVQPLEGVFWTLDSITSQWQPSPVVERYIAVSGMTSIAKYLSAGLDVRTDCLVAKVHIANGVWQVISDNLVIEAKALVIAIPAPQIIPLLGEIAEPNQLQQLEKIEYEPDLTVMAGYNNFPLSLLWRFLQVTGDANLARISWQVSGTETVFVVHSTAKLAKTHLDLDFTAAGEGLLKYASDLLCLPAPDWFKVHRWRYAFPKVVLDSPYLELATPLPLICCGDWSGDSLVESALRSGTSAAERLL